jgi:c(7)-type cytochrome triheme protein
LLFVVLAGPVSLAHAAGVLGDITIPRKGADPVSDTPQAFFPHWIHRTRFRCYVCHDTLFQRKLGADDINMDAVREGRFCGVCHDGKTAFAVGFDTCERCHDSPGGG